MHKYLEFYNLTNNETGEVIEFPIIIREKCSLNDFTAAALKFSRENPDLVIKIQLGYVIECDPSEADYEYYSVYKNQTNTYILQDGDYLD